MMVVDHFSENYDAWRGAMRSSHRHARPVCYVRLPVDEEQLLPGAPLFVNINNDNFHVLESAVRMYKRWLSLLEPKPPHPSPPHGHRRPSAYRYSLWARHKDARVVALALAQAICEAMAVSPRQATLQKGRVFRIQAACR
jgi:hypothetical protein